MSEELPEGWASALLGEITTIIGGGTPKSTDASNFSNLDGIPWITPADLSDYTAMSISRGRRNLTERGYQSCSAKMVPPHAVLFSSRAPIGYVAIAAHSLCTNQGFKTFICSEAIVPEFLYFYLRFAKPEIEQMASGTTFLEISSGRAAQIPIVVPPIAEQRRIVQKLEALLCKVAQSRARLARIPALLKRFRQSVLAAACSGRLTADWRTDRVLPEPAASTTGDIADSPAIWSWNALNELCDSNRGVCYGVIKLGEEVENGIPCLRTSDVKPLGINSSSVKRISRKISDEFRRSILVGGEILVNVRGTLGGVAVVPTAMQGWNVSREVAVVPVQAADARYVSLWIATQSSQNWLAGVAKGVAYTGINLEDLRKLPVPCPSVDEQKEIVRRVDLLFAVVNQLEARLACATSYVEKLTQSILAKAFRGELVPTEAELARRAGRTYEPATTPLDRLRSEKVSTTTPIKRKGKVQVGTRTETAAHKDRGELMLQILLLLEVWGKPVHIAALETSLVFFREPELADRVFGKSKKLKSSANAKKSAILGIDRLYREMVIADLIKPVGNHAYKLGVKANLGCVPSQNRTQAQKAIDAFSRLMKLRQLDETAALDFVARAMGEPHDLSTVV